MAFKMNGSPAKLGTISGTAGHRSALKAKTDEVLSSAFKISKEGYNEDGTPKFTDTKKTTDTSKSEENIKKSTTKTKKSDPYAEAKKKDPNLDKYIKERGKHKAGSAEYEALQAKINKAYGKTRSQKVKKAQMAADAKKATVSTAEVKPDSKAAEKQKKHENKIAKMDKKYNEREENRKVQDAKRTTKYAKEYFGKDSAEHATAKYEAAKAKGEDLAGAGGGKKAVFFGNLRRKWNQRKQDRLKGKADRLSKEKSDAEDKAIAEYNKNKKSPAKIYDKSGKRRKNYKY